MHSATWKINILAASMVSAAALMWTPLTSVYAQAEAPPEVFEEAEEDAMALLADETPAEDIKEEDLRTRVEEARTLLEEPQHPPHHTAGGRLQLLPMTVW